MLVNMICLFHLVQPIQKMGSFLTLLMAETPKILLISVAENICIHVICSFTLHMHKELHFNADNLIFDFIFITLTSTNYK